MPDIRLFCFGHPRITTGGVECAIERRKALALVAYLALSDRPAPRDVLATLLWPELDQDRARAALRSTLPVLTSLLPGYWLAADRTTIRLKREDVWVDVREYLSLLAQARSHDHPPEAPCPRCRAPLEEAIALYQDDFLAGFSLADSSEYDDWQATQRDWLRRECAGALRRVAHYENRVGNAEGALVFAQRWLALDPLNEAAHRCLMHVYVELGQRSEALRQYERCAQLLDSELATPPEHETQALHQAINAHTGVRGAALPRPAGDAQPSAAGILPPLPTLVIGRERMSRDLKARVGAAGNRRDRRSVTVLQGWPGVGKSTLVAALAHDPDIAAAFSDGILWASLGDTPNPLVELLHWAAALRLPASDHAPDPQELTRQLSAVLRDKEMLLIVDDVWREEHAAPFRVGGHGCALVMTSRLNAVAQALAPTPRDVYRLPVLDDAAALELLGILTPQTVAAHPDEARELVRDLEGLPLAIQVAGRLLQNEAQLGWGVGNLLRELREGAALLAASAPSDVAGAAQDTTPTIAALLRHSTDALDAQTRLRFALLGLFVPKPATFDLRAMAAAWETPDPKPTARLLVQRGLLEPVSGGRFQMHALLVLHAHSLLED